jgi:hypothetical protein
MGATIAAPDDEYDESAVDLIRRLQDMAPNDSVEVAVRAIWPQADHNLVEGVDRLWSRYVGQSTRAKGC